MNHDPNGPENAPQIASYNKSQAGDSEMAKTANVPWYVSHGNGWSGWWWAKKNHLCRRCALACKQSAKIKIIRCPQYEPKQER